VHISSHKVSSEEVEEVCHSSPLVQKGKKGRLLIIGFTKNLRMLTVILDPEEKKGTYYPVTARDSSRKEKRVYKLQKEVIESDKK